MTPFWRTFGHQPHRTGSLQRSMDPFYGYKVRDVVGRYLYPTEGAVVLCVDETTQIQALNRMPPIFTSRPGPRNAAATITRGMGRPALGFSHTKH
ncbi:MAG: hypothetical protein ACP5QO_10775 [Clostridia bacterium]